MRWFFLGLVCACGSRTDLSELPKRVDAGAVPQPCSDVDYASDALGVFPFTVTATHVYYVRYAKFPYELVRVPKGGGDPEVVYVFADGAGGRVLVDETSLYWLHTGDVLSAVNTGGPPHTIGHVGFLGGVMAQNETTLLVLLDPGSFGSLPKIGGDVVALAPPNAPTGPVVDAYADASRVYWITSEHVFALAIAPPFTLTSYGGWPTGLAIDDERVYWTTTNDVVRAANKDDASQTYALEGHARGPIAIGSEAVFGLAPHGTTSGIVKVPKAGGAETLVVPGVVPAQIVTDATCVYYSTTMFEKNGWPIQKVARFPQAQ